ncbi:ESPR-type extended signal peptide-containing protein [Pseudomonas sp. NPDC087029]|uniref:ESPR-type extended signal peptide-containing protein n=1 Tax=Pseudomonas sp. NPDC087029 TaxID=3364433 RepID=UPI0038179BA8
MNKTYAVIWNVASQTWVAVSELVARKRVSLSRLIMLSVLVALAGTTESALAGTCMELGQIGDGSAGTTTCGAFSIAIGAGSGATASNFGVAIGDAANSTGVNSVAIGRQSKALADGSTALGQNASADINSVASVALGQNSRVTAANATALGDRVQRQRARCQSAATA